MTQMSINTPECGHEGPASFVLEGDPVSFEPFPDARSLNLLHAGIYAARAVAADSRCAGYFARMPGQRTLQQLLASEDIWISYSPAPTTWVLAYAIGKEITIAERALVQGARFTAAILCHELSHANGIPGTRPDHIFAYLSPMQCRLPDPSGGVPQLLMTQWDISPEYIQERCPRCR